MNEKQSLVQNYSINFTISHFKCMPILITVFHCGQYAKISNKFRETWFKNALQVSDSNLTSYQKGMTYTVNQTIHSFIHLFHIPLILYRCGNSHVYIQHNNSTFNINCVLLQCHSLVLLRIMSTIIKISLGNNELLFNLILKS